MCECRITADVLLAAEKIVASEIRADKIGPGSISSDKIRANVITVETIAVTAATCPFCKGRD